MIGGQQGHAARADLVRRRTNLIVVIKSLKTQKEGAERAYEARVWTLKALVLVGPFFCRGALVLYPPSRSELYVCSACAQPICAYNTPRSIGFCVIWGCISSSSSSTSRKFAKNVRGIFFKSIKIYPLSVSRCF